jgi:hypothetical protein
VDVRYYIDPETDQPHIYRHAVEKEEVGDVLRRPMEDRPGREGSRVAVGRTEEGRYLRVVYGPGLRVRDHRLSTRPESGAGTSTSAQEEAMSQVKYPPGWDEERVRRVLEHYEDQSDEEALAEDEAAYEATTHTAMEVPIELVPVVRELIAKRSA